MRCIHEYTTKLGFCHKMTMFIVSQSDIDIYFGIWMERMICNQHYLIFGILWSESMVLNAYYQIMQHEDVSVTPQQKKCAPQITVTKCDGITGKHFRNDESQRLFFWQKKCSYDSYDSYDSYHVHSRDFDVSPFSEALFAKGLPKQLGRGNFFG